MSVLELPALRSDDPLGFLAALGVIEVLRSEAGVSDGELALAWEGVGGPAKLTGPFEDLEGLLAVLGAAAARMHAEGRPVPARIPDLVPRPLSDQERTELEKGTGVKPPFDPVRMSRAESSARVAAFWERATDADLRWLCGLVDQCSTFPGEATAHVTPLYAPMGRQRMRQVYEAKLAAVVARPELLREACVMWRRNPRDAGANLDRRAQRDGAVTTTGSPGNAAVTGAEWLALQSVPWFRLGGVRNRPFAWGWVPTRQGGRPRALVWAVWRDPLDPLAIEVLLTHPIVRAVGLGGGAADRRLARLGILAVLRAERSVLTNSDGPLGPARVLWPRASTAGG
jgi:hypothetical protein